MDDDFRTHVGFEAVYVGVHDPNDRGIDLNITAEEVGGRGNLSHGFDAAFELAIRERINADRDFLSFLRNVFDAPNALA